jgi:hypothetical protein
MNTLPVLGHAQVTTGGHTLISWAAAYGRVDVVDILLDFGATLGYGHRYQSACASMIQVTFRISRARKKSEAGGWIKAILALGAATSRMRSSRKAQRLPLAEAVYNCHFNLVNSLLRRKMISASHCRTWVRPCAPPPAPMIADGTVKHCALTTPMSLSDCVNLAAQERPRMRCAHAGTAGWVGEKDKYSYASLVSQAAAAAERQVEVVASAGAAEAKSRRHRREMGAARKMICAQLNTAIAAGDIGRAAQLLQQEAGAPSPDYESPRGRTALIAAAEEDPSSFKFQPCRNDEGDPVPAVSLLLDVMRRRPTVDYYSKKFGHTALTRASSLGRVEALDALLDYGASLDLAVGPQMRTPLAFAAAAGHVDAVRFLVARGADTHIKDADGYTPSDLARIAGFGRVAGELLAAATGDVGSLVFGFSSGKRLAPCDWGCGTGLEVGHAKVEHETSACSLRIVPCPNDCGVEGLQQRELLKHSRDLCSLRPVDCPRRCGVQFPACQLPHHDSSICRLRMTACDWCLSQIIAENMAQHRASECMGRLVPCPMRCKAQIKMGDVQTHAQQACPMRPQTCDLGCGAVMQFRLMPKHQQVDCTERPVSCPWSCGADLRAKHLADHGAECPAIPTPCPRHCGEVMPVLKLEDHSQTCGRRWVDCPLGSVGCGQKVWACDAAQHAARECRRRIVNCPNECGEEYFAEALGAHLQHGCIKRLVLCPSGCGERLGLDEVAEHRQNNCSRRMMRCPREGCYNRFVASDLDRHLSKECPRRLVLCLQGCGEQVYACRRRKHHEEFCKNRFQVCELGCGARVRLCDALEHNERVCVRRHLLLLSRK